ncbi:MAG: hypothetical protein SNJ73_00440 [Acetobacteraceae bacterium]
MAGACRAPRPVGDGIIEELRRGLPAGASVALLAICPERTDAACLAPGTVSFNADAVRVPATGTAGAFPGAGGVPRFGDRGGSGTMTATNRSTITLRDRDPTTGGDADLSGGGDASPPPHRTRPER